ncbi:ABC transporter substrate-binding protein [Methylobacterium planeticum]|uniref:ABC transporter substrate-binding protein n=1 Tax=Methylobacterium planeticum TaxID=2615211 RepID=A0A6N6MTB9_9HYPH|nr:ABC transporter substrate-binding protein [Methylobacterium planeticum]KAB1072958.1 ABC transporter substrate-binding protein [Methylobacterium planeticum]
MKRRHLVAAMAGALLAPRTGRAQQGRWPVVGFLSISSPEAVRPSLLPAFQRGLAEAGYVEGRNVAIRYVWAEGSYERLPTLAGELVQQKVDVIVAAGGTIAALTSRAATSDIPIVGLAGDDPVRLGLATSIGRPGGNFTGVVQLVVASVGKRAELLHELVPDMKVVAFLDNRLRTNAPQQVSEMQEASRALGLDLVVIDASDDEGLRSALPVARAKAGGLVLAGDPFFFARRTLITSLVQQHALPTIYFFKEFVLSGGLISYGSNLASAFRQIGVYAGRILAGAKASELPLVQQTDKLELVINLKAARALGLTVPTSILIQAEDVFD